MNRYLMMIAGITLAFWMGTGCSKKPEPAEETKTAAEHETGVVILTPENLKHVDIQVETVSLGKLEATLKAAGRVTENMGRTAHVASPLEGRLEKLFFDLGDSVVPGDLLAVVQTPELLGKPLEIKSPLAGIVMERKATPGELVDKATMIYTISDPSDLWVIAEIKESDIAAVKIDQLAAFGVLAYPGEIFTGRVVRLGNQVESESRTLEVRIAVDNQDARLKPGMFADVEISTTVMDGVLTISDASLQTDEEEQVVFVKRDDGSFEKRSVKLGLEQRGRVQILDGVREGEAVVTEGSFILKSELLKGELGEE